MLKILEIRWVAHGSLQKQGRRVISPRGPVRAGFHNAFGIVVSGDGCINGIQGQVSGILHQIVEYGMSVDCTQYRSDP